MKKSLSVVGALVAMLALSMGCGSGDEASPNGKQAEGSSS